MRTLEWKEGIVVTIDQTWLPHKKVILKMSNCRQVASAIKDMKIRGAPLLGVAAAYGVALTAYHSKAKKRETFMKEVEESVEILKKTRPTAVNLFKALNRIMKRVDETLGGVKTVAEALIDEAQKMAEEDVQVNQRIGKQGSSLVNDKDIVLTHCNAGSLATVDYGTALGVIRSAWEQGKRVKVVTTETRPKLQGARLTAYELLNDGIPVTLITDSMVGYAMYKGLINKVIVGADRIVQDAVINKIGTYPIAIIAHEHNIPFYVAAPTSTFDLTRVSNEVVIEERDINEVTNFYSKRVAPSGVEVFNPAFDITPMKYVSAIICETGVLSPTDLHKLSRARLLERG